MSQAKARRNAPIRQHDAELPENENGDLARVETRRGQGWRSLAYIRRARAGSWRQRPEWRKIRPPSRAWRGTAVRQPPSCRRPFLRLWPRMPTSVIDGRTPLA